MGDREYAFGKCSHTSAEGVLINKFNLTTSQRAQNITTHLFQKVNTTVPIRPLAVYLLIFDSVSRLHFYRNFPKTLDFLNTVTSHNSSVSIFDFEINNVNGVNTPPNMIPILFGKDLNHHKTAIQGLSINKEGDAWKFLELQEQALWKVFERQGFVTLFGYDTVWDYLTPYIGRVVATDHMIANSLRAAKRIFGYEDFAKKARCLGCQNAHVFPLDYLNQYNVNYHAHNRFAYLHLSPGHEETGTVIRTADVDLKEFLSRFLTEQRDYPNEDFVLMIGSDHGKHPGVWDTMHESFIENQLPMHFLITNSELLHRLGPNTSQILQRNSKRLTSRYDWNLSLKHLSIVPYASLAPDSSIYTVWKVESETDNALSLFLEPIPDTRTCADVRIPLHFCSCIDYQEASMSVSETQALFRTLATLGVTAINSHLRVTDALDLCYQVSLKEIVKVLIQTSGEGGNNYQVRFSINEDKNALFDVIVYVESSLESMEVSL